MSLGGLHERQLLCVVLIVVGWMLVLAFIQLSGSVSVPAKSTTEIACITR